MVPQLSLIYSLEHSGQIFSTHKRQSESRTSRILMFIVINHSELPVRLMSAENSSVTIPVLIQRSVLVNKYD